MQIILSHISKSYDHKPVLTDISLTIAAQDAVVITGPSGIGKTTLLRILTKKEVPDQGSIRMRQDDGTVMEGKAWKPHFGADFQEDRLVEYLTAVENVLLVMHGKATPTRGGYLAGNKEDRPGRWNKKGMDQFVRQELGLLLPDDELDKPVEELSGGMRRRVCLVRAMILPKDLYVLDEPFTGLDASTRTRCIQYVQNHQRTAPLVMSAHDLHGLEWMKEFRLGTAYSPR